MIVAQNGSGDFRTVQAAIDAVPADHAEPLVIQIKNGIYREKIRIDKPLITLIGENAAGTVLTYDDAAKKLLPNGEPMNTFNSYSAYIGGLDFRAENITFANTAGDGRKVGQALALYADADRMVFRNCRFLGCQDTVFNGPLPKYPTPKGLNLIHPTLGLDETEYPGTLRQYFEDCYIEGDIDFIFGSAIVVFNRCEIVVNDRQEPVNGYITAGSQSTWLPYGHVFLDCRLTSRAAKHSVYLGRPWRDHAKAAFINCWMGEHIHPAGWHNWDQPHREQTVRYLEYRSHGPGANDAARVSWSKILTDPEATAYTAANILAGSDGWNPAK